MRVVKNRLMGRTSMAIVTVARDVPNLAAARPRIWALVAWLASATAQWHFCLAAAWSVPVAVANASESEHKGRSDRPVVGPSSVMHSFVSSQGNPCALICCWLR